MRSEKKHFHIPRKVTEGIKIFNLDGKGMIIIASILGAVMTFDFLSTIPVPAKIIISTLIMGFAIGLFTVELGSGLLAITYIRMKIIHILFAQKRYNIDSSYTLSQHDKTMLRSTVYKKTVTDQEREQLRAEIITSVHPEFVKISKGMEE